MLNIDDRFQNRMAENVPTITLLFDGTAVLDTVAVNVNQQGKVVTLPVRLDACDFAAISAMPPDRLGEGCMWMTHCGKSVRLACSYAAIIECIDSLTLEEPGAEF